MNDPWDVKSVRLSDQYMSCMKLNGVPLLPPILSRECRKEMQYYKLLAREVEKRIHALKPYAVESDSESNTDKTDAPELPESEQSYELPSDELKTSVDVDFDKNVRLEKSIDDPIESLKLNTSNTFENITSNFTTDADSTSSKLSSKLVIDLSLSINDTGRNLLDSVNSSQTQVNDLPERDCNCPIKRHKELLTDVENHQKYRNNVEDKNSFSVSVNNKSMTDPITNTNFSKDGPPSLGSKSFTGSLNDLHIESMKESEVAPLIRQRSYTVLKPSPMLLAHLEVQSLNTGVDVKSISMSESLSNLSCSNKKRRSWDLESAKVKWSSMAMELKEKVAVKSLTKGNNPKLQKINTKSVQNTPPKAKSLTLERVKRSPIKSATKSDPIQKPKKTLSPIRNPLLKNTPKSLMSEPDEQKDEVKQKSISECEDPATRVRELYEKIQKQQLVQMANLVDKQKREQMLLQQVFEEQNNLLFTQLKTICPKSSNEVKEAWVEKTEADRGPVSLSQLIDHKSTEQHIIDSPVLTTLTETNNYINHCDRVLKKSRDISISIKKQQTKSRTQDDKQSVKSVSDGSRTRTHSPNNRNTPASRKLTYETSAFSDHEYQYDPILTDRTNDTLADLNVTFTSDNTEECQATVPNNLGAKNNIQVHSPLTAPLVGSSCISTDRAIRSMEETIHNSINSMCVMRGPKQKVSRKPTARERAAATTIVAHAKGFLVRRLMKTERVQATVQTINDALLCALQLHQDRAGIRGADVDLHRRLIQQITAACYSLHDTFVASSPAERCAALAADRSRRRALAARPPRAHRPTDLMSHSHSGVFPARAKRASPSLMTQSNYETFSADRTRRYVPSPLRRPWR